MLFYPFADHRLLSLTAMFAASCLGACSSVPDFKPTSPVEKAANFNEALSLCAAYQVKAQPGEAKVKVAALVPWISCFEKAVRLFPQGQQSTLFIVFFRSLSARHDYVAAPHDEIADPARLNRVVTHAIAAAQNPARLPDGDDYRYSLREFPRYAEYLEEQGLFRGIQARSGVLEDELGPLQTDLAAASRAASRPSSVHGLSEIQKAYCSRFRAHLVKVQNLRELIEYKDILTQKADDAPAMLERVQKRADAMKAEALQTHETLNQELGVLRAQASWFDNRVCLR